MSKFSSSVSVETKVRNSKGNGMAANLKDYAVKRREVVEEESNNDPSSF